MVRVHLRPQLEPPDIIGRHLVSVRLEQKGKLAQQGVVIDLQDL